MDIIKDFDHNLDICFTETYNSCRIPWNWRVLHKHSFRCSIYQYLSVLHLLRFTFHHDVQIPVIKLVSIQICEFILNWNTKTWTCDNFELCLQKRETMSQMTVVNNGNLSSNPNIIIHHSCIDFAPAGNCFPNNTL